jgi:hypothetical protein
VSVYVSGWLEKRGNKEKEVGQLALVTVIVGSGSKEHISQLVNVGSTKRSRRPGPYYWRAGDLRKLSIQAAGDRARLETEFLHLPTGVDNPTGTGG